MKGTIIYFLGFNSSDNNVYLNALLGYEENDVKTIRNIHTDNSNSAYSHRDDNVQFARVEIGLKQDYLNPYIAAGLISHNQGRYLENTDSGLGLKSNRDRKNNSFYELGLRFKASTENFDFYSSMSHQWFNNRNWNYEASFINIDENFNLTSPNLNNKFNLRFGTNYKLNDKVNLYGIYSIEKSKHQNLNNVFELGASVKF